MRIFGYEIIKAKKFIELQYVLAIKSNSAKRATNKLINACEYKQGTIFKVANDDEKFIVFCDVVNEDESITMKQIKTFPYGDNKQYAKVCAEELCELLNQEME